jgi:hypothetical protein
MIKDLVCIAPGIGCVTLPANSRLLILMGIGMAAYTGGKINPNVTEVLLFLHMAGFTGSIPVFPLQGKEGFFMAKLSGDQVN